MFSAGGECFAEVRYEPALQLLLQQLSVSVCSSLCKAINKALLTPLLIGDYGFILGKAQNILP